MPIHRQTNFISGELAPTLWGRTDLARYASGLRRCKNFFVSTHGSAVSRPGTQFLTAIHNESAPVRLIPFVFSEDDSIVIELGNLYAVFYSQGSKLPGVVVTTPWPAHSLYKLRYAQVGNTIIFTHPDEEPRELVRVSNFVWTLTKLKFDLQDYVGHEPCLVDGDAANGYPEIKDPDDDHPAREWTWRVSLLLRGQNGVIYETKTRQVKRVVTFGTGSFPPPVNFLDIPEKAEWAIYPDRPIHLDFTMYGLWGGDQIMGTRIYRGRGNVFGLVGEVKGAQNDNAEGGRFIDYGYDPDYLRPPPEGRNPFKVFNGDAILLRTETPTTLAFFEQRMFLGGTKERPEYLWGSATNDYFDFDERYIATPEASLELELACRKREVIRSMVALDRLLVFTQSSVWAVGGAGGPMAPTELNEARVQADVGIGWVEPLVVGDTVLFVRAKGTGVRDLFYDDRGRAYTGSDITFLVRHLLQGRTIKEWAYAEDPWALVWAVTSDGKLLSCTYDRSQQVLAWAWHETDGVVESICSVPESDHDAVYMTVRRVVNGVTHRYLERLARRDVQDVQDAICTDCSRTTSVSGGGGEITIAALNHLEGRQVKVVVSGQVVVPTTKYPLTVSGGLIKFVISPGTHTIHVGLGFVCELETLDVPAPRGKKKVVKKVTVHVEGTKGLWAGSAPEHMTEWRDKNVSDNYEAGALTTGKIDVIIPGGWNDHGRAVIQQRDPLPATVLGIDREGDIAD